MNLRNLSIAGSLLFVAASASADLRSDTQKQFDKYCVAVKKKDAQQIEKVLRNNFAPDFKFVPQKGKSIGLTEWVDHEKMQVKVTQIVKSVTLHADSTKMDHGTATMKITLSYVGIAKLDPKGKAGLLEYVAKSEQTMVQKNGKWWITEMREGGSTSKFNGKPIG